MEFRSGRWSRKFRGSHGGGAGEKGGSREKGENARADVTRGG